MGGSGGFQSARPDPAAVAANNAAALAAQKKKDDDTMKAYQEQIYGSAPGTEVMAPNQDEQSAGINASFRGVTDPKTGQLLDQYKVNPFAGDASKQLRSEALLDPSKASAWTAPQLSQQQFEEGQSMGAAGAQQQSAESNARSSLMRFGGMGGGARTSLARSGARDLLMAKQNVGAQGVTARAGITNADLTRRQGLLGTTADVERQGDLKNLESLQGNMANRQAFDINRYNQLMAAWGAKKTAAAMG